LPHFQSLRSDIRKLHEKFRGKAQFWLVYPDAGESASRIRTYDEQFHFVIPALRDVHRELVKRSHATITPEAAVFDSVGKLVYHGRIDDWYEDFGRSRAAPTTQELDNAIRNTLDGKPTVPDHANAVGLLYLRPEMNFSSIKQIPAGFLAVTIVFLRSSQYRLLNGNQIHSNTKSRYVLA